MRPLFVFRTVASRRSASRLLFAVTTRLARPSGNMRVFLGEGPRRFIPFFFIVPFFLGGINASSYDVGEAS